MSAPSSAFQEYLADDEAVITGTLGTLIDRSYRLEGSIGVTDRRVLFVSDRDRFMDFTFDAIDSIQSHVQATVSSRTIGYWGVLILGLGIAVGAIIGMVSIQPSILAASLTVLAIGGTITAEYTRRHGFGRVWSIGSGVVGHVRGRLDQAGIRWDDHEPLVSGDPHDTAVFGLGIVASTALLGLVAITESLSVIPLALVALGGIALTNYGNSKIRALDANDENRQYERTVSIHLSSGQVVHLRVDAAIRIDHEISGLARETTRARTALEWPESNTDRSDGSPSRSRAPREPVDSTD